MAKGIRKVVTDWWWIKRLGP